MVSPPLITRCTSTKIKAEKIAMAKTITVNIRAGNCNQIFANEATIRSNTPTISHLPIPAKSLLLTVAIVAIVAKIAAVPPNDFGKLPEPP